MQIEDAKISKLVMDFERGNMKNRPCSIRISGNILTPKATENELCFVFLTIRLKIEEGAEFFNLTLKSAVHYKSNDPEEIKRKEIQREALPVMYAKARELYEHLGGKTISVLPPLPSLEDLSA